MLVKLRVLLLLLFITLPFQVTNSQTSDEKIDSAIFNENFSLRGKISEENGAFTLFFFDKYEKDSHVKFLQDKGFHGGGPSWLALIYALFNDYETNLIDDLSFDVQVSGITFKTTNKEDLVMVSRAISLLKSDQQVMLDVIEKAKALDVMK